MAFSSPSRPRTPSRSPAPLRAGSEQPPPPPPETPQDEPQQQPQRRTSFSFLRRGKSVERLNSKRSVSGGKLHKKQKQEQSEMAIPDRAPKIPDLATTPRLATFGGDGIDSSRTFGSNQSHAMPLKSSPYNVPIPNVPTDPYARTESMTNRGRYSYASSAVSTLNSPRRVRRRKDPTPFNILVVGARNSGKTAFIEFLRNALALPARKQRPNQPDPETNEPARTRHSTDFVPHYLETEILSGERVGLTLWDSKGLDRNVIDLQLRDIAYFIESRFEETFLEETKVIRTPGAKDPHIHCVFLLLDPINLNQTLAEARKIRDARQNGNFSNGKSYLRDNSPEGLPGLDENLDLQVLRSLQGKSTVIPVIAKADTITLDQMIALKRAVWKSLKGAKLDPFEALGLDEEEDNDDSEAVDSDSSDAEDTTLIARTPASKHSRHDSKRFNEADEDELVARSQGLQPGEISHFDSASSSSASSFNVSKTQKTPSKTNLRNVPGSQQQQAETVPSLPFSTLNPDPIVPHQPVQGATGRRFAWGFADPYNPEHCDFVRLKETIFREWFSELREASREIWYENWRTSRLDGPRAKAGRPAPSYTTSTAGRDSYNTGSRQVSSNSRAAVPPSMVPTGISAGTIAQRTPSRGPPQRQMAPQTSSQRMATQSFPQPQAMQVPNQQMRHEEGQVGIAR